MEVPESLLNRQLTLDFFKNQISADVVKNIRKMTFCGNDGDPIYCREFLEICEWLKQVNPDIHLVIITNGSHKPTTWWAKLGKILNHNDELHWSLDGWDQESNENYRVNSDWSTILDGIREFKLHNKQTYTVWAAIAFKFNQDNLDRMKLMAVGLDFDLFQLTKSTKFGSHYPEAYGINDPLCPDRSDLISSGHRFERMFFPLSQRVRPGQELKKLFFTRAQDLQKQNLNSGICFIGNKGVFLNSRGEFYPCCWTANRYEHNRSWHELAEDRFNLNKRSFQDVINDEFWTGDFLKFDSLECQTKCTMEKLSDPEHTTEW